MKAIKEKYEPINEALRLELEEYQANKKYIRLHYFNEYHEYISVAAVIKQITTQPEGEYLLLNTGEAVRLDKIVRLEGKPAPGYDIQDFTCDC